MRPLIILFTLAVLGGGCSSTRTVPVKNSHPSPVVVDNGYALLLDLMGDEKDVSKVLIVKRDHDDLNALIKEIATRCRAAHEEIQNYFKMVNIEGNKMTGLPPAEVAARKSISSAKAKELLTSSGKEFELLLLLTQDEALAYGTHIASVIAKNETDATRAKSMQRLSDDLDVLRQKVIAFMVSKYSWTQ